MARRKQESGLDIFVSMPWPAGVIAGVLGFVTIRWGFGWYFSSMAGPFPKGMGQHIGGTLTPLASLVLIACWTAAFFSHLERRKRTGLLEQQSGLHSLKAMTWKQFELLVGEAYRRHGYTIEETGQGGSDGGIDLFLRKDATTTLVQCKQWRTQQVGVNVVREMLGLMTHHGASAGIIACVGKFTPDAEAFALGKSIELVSGTNLLELVRGVQAKSSLSADEYIGDTTSQLQLNTNSPQCPRCGSSMTQRKNRNSGQTFWGCSAFPACKGTVSAGRESAL